MESYKQAFLSSDSYELTIEVLCTRHPRIKFRGIVASMKTQN